MLSTDQITAAIPHALLRVDLPGFGLTGPSPQGDYRIDAYTRFVLRLMDTLEVKRVVLVGNALGGEIAWQTAILAPERVHKLVLIDADGYQPSVLSMPIGFQIASMRGLRWVSERILPRPLMAASLRSVFGEPDQVTAERVDRYFELNLRVGNRRALFQRMDQATFGESAPLIRRITQPTGINLGSVANRRLGAAEQGCHRQRTTNAYIPTGTGAGRGQHGRHVVFGIDQHIVVGIHPGTTTDPGLNVVHGHADRHRAAHAHLAATGKTERCRG